MDGWVRIGDVDVDVPALRRLAHTCDPMRCRHTKNCCRHYEVTVEPGEIARIAGCTPDAARLAPALRANGEIEDPIDETDGGFCLNTDERGQCVFAYTTGRGAVLCSLHTLALEWDLPPAQVKPKACALWPLAIHGDDPVQLSVQDDAYEFPCNSRRNANVRALHPGVAETIEAVFGKKFLDELTEAIKSSSYRLQAARSGKPPKGGTNLDKSTH